MLKIKSITPVLNKTGWVARVRAVDHSAPFPDRTVFHGIGAGYTMHQAQVLCDSLRRDVANHGPEIAL